MCVRVHRCVEISLHMCVYMYKEGSNLGWCASIPGIFYVGSGEGIQLQLSMCTRLVPYLAFGLVLW